MKITLEVRHISIPFRFSYGHSKASHQGVESVLCIVQDENGICGYGEAVPRHYVTGESCASVMKDVVRIFPSLRDAASDVKALKQILLEMAKAWQGPFPSCAFCGIELALLDLISRQAGLSFSSVLGEKQTKTLSYSGSIGMGNALFLKAQLLAYKAMGLKSFKLKVGGKHDVDSLKMVRRVLGNEVRIFVDANGAWDRETALCKIEEFHAFGVWAIEEPLKRSLPPQDPFQRDCEETLNEQHYLNNAWLRKRSPLPLIADESIISPRSLQAVVEYEAFDVVDIRLSKLGGCWLSANAVEQITDAGLQFYIGAMVGESVLLATAGSNFGSVYAKHLLIQGHSHRVLHAQKIMKGGLRLQRGGRLQLDDVPGLGVVPLQSRLDAVTMKKEFVAR